MEPADFAHFADTAAQQFLKELPPLIRERGEAYLQEGRVRDLRCDEPGSTFTADVEGGTLYQTTLRYDPESRSWWEECSCPMGGGCKHAYAAMKALLVEHSAAAVQSLSSGKKVPKKQVFQPLTSGVLAKQASAALGRELSRAESDFVRRLEERFEKLRERPFLTGDDLIGFGFKFAGTNAWEKLDAWPATPKVEGEFCRFVALAAEERGLAWPEFLRPLTDLAEARQTLARWRRGRDVDRWKNLLTNLQLGPADDARPTDEVELRLRVTEAEGLVEFRKPGALDWSTIKPGKFKEFDEKSGDLLAPEVALLWQPLAQRARFGYAINLMWHDTQTRRMLNRFLRLPALRPHIVGTDGDPLRRPEAPLRWELAPALDESDDYRLQLRQGDGSPVPKFLLTLPGRPTLYLTTDTVSAGPPVEDRALDPAASTPIPAPALETPVGVRFLQHLAIPLPPRLADRVRVVPLSPRLTAELRTIAFGNDTEYAVLDVNAVSPDGLYAERWNGSAWLDAKLVPTEDGEAAVPKSAMPLDEALVTYDRTLLGDVPRLLEPAGFKWDFARQRWLMRVTAKFPDLFMAWLTSVPLHVALDLRGQLASFLNATVAGQVRLDVVETSTDWFDLKIILDVSDTQLTKAEVKLLLDARGKWVRLGDKGWKKLEFKLSADEDAQLAKLGLSPHELTGEPQRLHALQLADPAAKTFVGEETFLRIQRRVAEIQARVTPEVPAALKAELRPYQKEGFHFLCYLSANRFGGILADDMGLGKTLQTLAWLVWLREEEAKGPLGLPSGTSAASLPSTPVDEDAKPAKKPAKAKKKSAKAAAMDVDGGSPDGPTAAVGGGSAPFLVVCPKSVTDNWRAEVMRFAPHLRVRVWSGDDVGDLPAQAGSAELHVINYNQLRIAGEAFTRIEFLAVILDEGQYIKNPTSITAQIARGLRARHRLVLSGTPIENKLLDLWSLMSFAMPGALGGKNEFAKVFDSKTDSLARQRLAARVRPFLLRRTKTQVAKDLPDRIEEDLFCEMEGDQKTLYRAELKRAQAMLLRVNTPAALSKHRFNFLTSLLRLRQICCHPRLAKPDSKGESAKVGALMETLEPLMEEGQKVLVFSQFVEMLDLLKAGLAERGWPTFFLSGATENRGELVRQFQAAEGESVFLISLKAGGFGLNLTAASYVVLFDPWWNPAVEAQAIDRTHRIGQTQKVIAYRLLIKDSVEEKIRALQRTKSALALDVLGEEKFAQSLSLDDLRFLLAD